MHAMAQNLSDCHAEGGRAPACRGERESKHPEGLSFAIPTQGILLHQRCEMGFATSWLGGAVENFKGL